jgi:alcohol dehydrogenase class IV
MINKQTFQFPVIYTNTVDKIAIGWGVHETVADECKQAGIKKALITTTGLKGTGIVEEINHILTTHGVSTEIYNKVTSNPKDYEVMDAYEAFKEAKCDGVVSVGGGSSHDCGKLVRAVAANGGRHVCDMAIFLDPPWMEEVKKLKPVTLPQISVNTTAGTGAEASFATNVVNTKVRAKQVVIVPGITPAAALIDPLLVRLMPQNMVAWTGFDALAHGVEGFLSRVRSRHSAALMLGTVKLVAENLREFANNRMNHVACENMCWAESMGGVGIALGAGAGIIHGLGHQIQAVTDCHHGHVNAVLMPIAERYNEAACPERFAELAQAMGVDTRGMTKMQAADKWFDEIERLVKDLNIEIGNLNKQFGLQQKDVEHIVKIYSNDFCKEGNPRDFNFDECVKLLESML